MTVLITAIKLSGTSSHEHITDYRFDDDGSVTWRNKRDGVAWVQKHPLTAKVTGSKDTAYVYVIENGGSPFLRTIADHTYTDNLLSLPVIPS
jgi:hypothetical protein